MVYAAIRRLLFQLDPESAHELAVEQMRRLQSSPPLLRAIAAVCRPPSSAARELLGLSFPSLVGIAAGFDKNAELVPMLTALGFGFVEVGTVTLRPQPGNPRPRMFRYPAARAIVNRMGFNNDGADAVAARLRHWRDSSPAGAPPLFVNIGKNREVALDAAPRAYAECYARLAPYADACVLNVSSPNTPSLRDLQRPEHLESIVAAVRAAGPRRPLFVKIAPDVDDAALGAMTELCTRVTDGMICTNTTIDHESGMNENGGVSGLPLRGKATAVLRRVRELAGPSFPLIGVGGVFTAADVAEKLAAGADLVQVYTGFIYEGPLLARRLARAVLPAGSLER